MSSSVSSTSSSRKLEAALSSIGGASTPTIRNITLAASTEETVSITAATKIVKFKSRDCATLQYAFVATESGTKFITVDAGNEVILPLLLDTSSPTLYIQSNVATTLEVETWE